MDQDPKLNRAKIAAREGISRARVTQIMDLLKLPEGIQNHLLRPPAPLEIHSFPERRLRLIVRCGGEKIRIRRCRELLEEVGNSAGKWTRIRRSRGGSPRSRQAFAACKSWSTWSTAWRSGLLRRFGAAVAVLTARLRAHILPLRPMSVTVNLSSDEVAQIKRFTDLENEDEAVAKAAREFLRVIQLRELKTASGNVDYEDVGSRMEALELPERRLNQ